MTRGNGADIEDGGGLVVTVLGAVVAADADTVWGRGAMGRDGGDALSD